MWLQSSHKREKCWDPTKNWGFTRLSITIKQKQIDWLNIYFGRSWHHKYNCNSESSIFIITIYQHSLDQNPMNWDPTFVPKVSAARSVRGVPNQETFPNKSSYKPTVNFSNFSRPLLNPKYTCLPPSVTNKVLKAFWCFLTCRALPVGLDVHLASFN
jgi:hypothetical protein